MIREDETIKVGHLGKPHGVRGEINFSFTTDVWDRAEAQYLLLMVDGILVPFFLEEYRFRSDNLALLKFLDLDSLEAVQEYVGAEVYFPYSLMPEDDAAEYTWSYFKGFRVVDDDIGELGEITDVDDTTENVLFEVSTANGSVLVPAVEAFIRDIDHEGHVVHMQLPDGLLDIDNMKD